MEIEEGEYIRTTKGYIGKYQKSVEGFDEFIDNEGIFILGISDIVNHSKNIIDLIEVGDYVNGVEVIEISSEIRNDKKEKCLYMLSDMGTGWENTLFIEHIKSIVTKEQYKTVEYKVEE